MTLLELIESGYQKDKNLNCSETILLGANEAYKLGLKQETLKLAAFEQIYGTTNCKILKAKYRTQEKGCHDLISGGGKIIDTIRMQ